jgi:hypothetical protein
MQIITGLANTENQNANSQNSQSGFRRRPMF